MLVAAKKPAWIALGIALAFHVLLLSLHTNQRGEPGVLRVWLMDALVPLEKLTDRSIGGLWGIWDGYVALIGVSAENEELRKENDRLRLELAIHEEALREAERLRRLVGLSDAAIGRTIAARVIGRDPSRSLQTVTIDKGRAHGVRENASVVTADGVVGRVIQPASRSAIVQLITDAQSAVGVLVGPSRVQAVFRGTGGRGLELDYIDDDSEIATGDEMITSGLDQIHPKGLPLAIVTSVGPRAGLFKEVSAEPRADLSRLEEVLVITELKADPALQENSDPMPATADP